MHKPVKHLAVAAASIVVAVGSPAAQTIDMVVDGGRILESLSELQDFLSGSMWDAILSSSHR